MNRFKVAAEEALRLMVAGMESDAVTLVRRAGASHGGADTVLALCVIDRMIERHTRWSRNRLIVDDWSPAMVAASTLYRARMHGDTRQVEKLLRRVSCLDVLAWAARVVRETAYLERAATAPRPEPEPEPKGEPDPAPPTTRPPGGWIQRADDWL